MVYSNKQLLQHIGIQVDDLDHQSGLLLARLYPDVADGMYLLSVVLSLRQRDGAIAIPWPDAGSIPVAAGDDIDESDSADSVEVIYGDLYVGNDVADNGNGVIDVTSGDKNGSTVLDLLAENLPRVVTGLTSARVRQAFSITASIPLKSLINAGGIVDVSNAHNSPHTVQAHAVKAHAVIVLDAGRLYLRRFWRYEMDVAEMVNSRSIAENIGASVSGDETSQNVNTSGLATEILQSGTASESTGQEKAVQAGLNYRFAVITGGPGTGKTHSVLLLLTAMLAKQPDLRVVLCAPTGKAAARMMESIQGNLERINPPEAIRQSIPETASTIHRLIRWNPARGRSVYHAENPLPYDLVILDEASMVDAALMARLARALRPETRLILLGDKDQLSSVEAGSVFADIASREAPNVIRLTKSWRFSDDSEIGILAKIINSGDGLQSWKLLETGGMARVAGASSKSLKNSNPSKNEADHNVVPTSGKTHDSATEQTQKASERSYFRGKASLYKHVLNGVLPLFEDISAEVDHVRALRLLQRYQVLTALRVGPFGAEQINAQVDQQLGGGKEWYEGRPVMATANNYDLEIYNGDVGLLRRIDGRLMVAFAGLDPGSVRWIAPAQLKSVASAWALTVHKSQGSEYDEVLFVTPDRWSPVMSRELAYTALTRSRSRFEIWGTKELWIRMLNSQVERFSGLAKKL
jgi:exodeoxyribonuclease V alpha subunit